MIGDISVRIRPDGWTAELSVEGFTRGSTYDFDLGVNNVPGANTPYLDVISLGFDDTGAATTVTRRVYLTPRGTSDIVRFPYGTVYLTGTYDAGAFEDGETVIQATSGATGVVVGDQSSGDRLYFKSVTGTFDNTNQITGSTSGATFTSASTITTPSVPTNDEQVSSTGLIAVVSLSDYVYQKDNTGGGNSGTAPTVTIPAAFITNTGGAAQTSNALSAAAVTQDSTASYPKVIANWSWPGNQRIDGPFTLRAVAFHGTSVFTDATTQVGGGKANIACVVFVATDESANDETQTVTAPTVDSSMLDAVPVVEWVATMPVTSLTQGELLTCNFVAYPLVGDSDSVLDTSAGTAQPTPLYGPITMVCDKSDAYGRTFAAVSSSGNDTTGIAVKREDYASDALADAAAVATPCLTIGGAYAKIVAKNLADRSRNDGGAGEIILTAGTFAWVGAGSAFGVKPECWPIIRPSDGVARADAIVSGQTGGTDLKDMVKFSGVTIGGAAAFMFLSIDTIWFDQCVMSATGSAVVNNGCLSQYWTRNVMAGFVQGILPSTLWTSAPAIVRGNNLNGFLKSIQTYTVLGNLKTSVDISTTDLFVKDRGTVGQQGMPNAINTILAYNKILGFNVTVTGIAWGMVNANSHGAAIVQNLFENYDNGVASLGDIAGGGAATPVNNILRWHNTFVGQRTLNAYNDTGSVSFERKFWSEKNNIDDYYAIKSDTFTTANGNRVGNWPEVFGVNASGNLVASLIGFGSGVDDFVKEFAGLGTLQNGTAQANDYVKYTNDLAYKGGADTTGGGTYTLEADSPAMGLQRDWLLPFDIAGNPRTATSSAGAYAPLSFGKLYLMFFAA